MQATKEKVKPAEVDDPCWHKGGVTWRLVWGDMVAGYVEACMVRELREFMPGAMSPC